MIVVAMLILSALQPVTAAVQWERVDDGYPETALERLDQEQIEISVRDGYVYVYSPRPVNVRIFTILGQPVTSETVGPGGARFRIGVRGIYILKVAGITRRITI